MLDQALKEDLSRDPTGFQNAWIGQGVVHFRPGSLSTHDAQLSHDSQVLADLCLSLPGSLHQVLDRAGFLAQQGEEFQACWFRQNTTEICLQSVELLFLLTVHFNTPLVFYKLAVLFTALIAQATACALAVRHTSDQSLWHQVPVGPIEELLLHVIVQAGPWWAWWVLIVEDELGRFVLPRL